VRPEFLVRMTGLIFFCNLIYLTIEVTLQRASRHFGNSGSVVTLMTKLLLESKLAQSGVGQRMDCGLNVVQCQKIELEQAADGNF
jgi:hypothetical protein